MFHIILMILSIIGILLLAVLVLVLSVSLAVLFVPVRYRINGEKGVDSLLVTAEASWFFRLLRGKAVYPKPGRIKVKFLWFTLYDSTKKTKKEKESSKAAGTEPDEDEAKEKGKSPSSAEEGKSGEEERAGAQAEEREAMQNGPGTDGPREGAGQEEPGKTGRLIGKIRGFLVGIAEKIRNIFQKICDALKNIWYTIGRLCDKIKKICENIGYYMEVLGEEETKAAFLLCCCQLAKIWKNIRPKTCSAKLLVGTGEPDTTGYILALGGILYPLIGNDIVIEPDFENQVLEGIFSVKGRITVFVLLYAAIKIYFDKNIRYFLKRFKREE